MFEATKRPVILRTFPKNRIMNKPAIEKVLTLLGALLIVLFALGFVVPAIGAWQSEIRLFAVLGVVMYAAYSFWNQQSDAKALHLQELESAKWRNETQKLREALNESEAQLRATQASLQEAATSLERTSSALQSAEAELLECRQRRSDAGE